MLENNNKRSAISKNQALFQKIETFLQSFDIDEVTKKQLYLKKRD